MIKLSEAAGRVIADDITQTLVATDDAVATGVRMVMSVLEGTRTAGIPHARKQKLLDSMHSGLGGILDGRRLMVDAHTQMVVIHRASNIAETDFGCLGGPDRPPAERQGFFTQGSATVVPAG